MIFSVTTFIWIYTLLVSLFCWKHVSCGSYNDTKTLLAHLLGNYDVNVRPLEDQDDSVSVTAQMYVKSIQEFDEVKEMFSFVGAILIMWHDVNMQWDPAQYGGTWQVTVSYSDVWIPELVLSTPSDDVESLGKKWNRIRFYSNGLAQWLPADLIKSTCSVNVENYPFDTQACVTSFIAMGYTSDELTLVPMTTKINMDIYQENSLWDIVDTEAAAETTGGGSKMQFKFYLKRKPSFVIINVLLPILFLSLLNVLVFLLVPESGERVSYCVTVLLAIAVFMTIVSDMLPRSSQPVPIISYKLMIDMISSSLIVLVTILNFRIYSKDDREPVPKWLTSVYNALTCVCCRGKKITPGHIDNVYPFVETLNSKDSRSTTIEVNDRDKITWKMVSFMFDWIFLALFTLMSAISFGVFIAVTAV